MEQAVWFYVGILVAMIGLGLLVSVVLMGTDTAKQQMAKNNANSLEIMCNNVCGSDIGTVLGIKPEISSGSIIKSNGNAICVVYKEIKDCRRCDCEVVGADFKPFELNLATEEAIKMFDTHAYNCTFERDVNVVVLRCKG